ALFAHLHGPGLTQEHSAMRVYLTFDSGETLVFDERVAANRGTYRGEHVTQSSREQRQGDLTVHFRRDPDGRREVVVELGLIDPSAPRRNLGGYVALIEDGGFLLAEKRLEA